MTYFINNKFGFVKEFYKATDETGKAVIKAKHCLDIREALPFNTRLEAERAYKKTYMRGWWYCVVCSADQPETIKEK